MEAGADGSVYLLDCGNPVLQRISPNGTLQRLVGTGVYGATNLAETDPTQIALSIQPAAGHQAGIGLDHKGGVYITHWGGPSNDVLYFSAGGALSAAVPVTWGAALSSFRDVAAGPDGDLILATDWASSVQKIVRYHTGVAGAAGTMELLAGTGTGNSAFASLPNIYPAQATVGTRQSVQFGPDGQLYFAESVGVNARIRRMNARLLHGKPATRVASQDGTEVYVFDENGRHYSTKNPQTGADIYSFAYTSAGLLESITDVAGNITTLERDSAGVATAIVAPFGQRTELTYDTDGYLESIETSENDEPHSFVYGATGLMSQQTDPRGATHDYEYDSNGRIALSEDSEGGSWTYTRSEGDGYRQVTRTTALGRATTYRQEKASSGEARYIVTLPSGAQNTLIVGVDGVAKTSMADGSVITRSVKAHPLYGANTPVVTEAIATRGTLGTTVTRTMARTVVATGVVGGPGDWFGTALVETNVENGTYQSTRSYNPTNRTWTMTSAAGRVTKQILDPLGRTSSSEATGTVPVTFDYDTEGRIDTITQGSRSSSYEYDAVSGFLASFTDAADQTTTYTTDDVGRITAVEDANEDVTAFAYDDESNVVGVTPPGREVHELSYSSVDLYDGYIAPEQGSVPRETSLSYDVDRQLTEIEQPDGTSLIYSYGTSSGLLTQATIPGAGTYTYGYNGGSQLTSISTTGGFGNLTIEYGAGTSRGRFPLRMSTSGLSTAGTWFGSLAGSVEYTYSNRLLPLTVQPRGATGQPVGNTATFSWDPDRLMSGIAVAATSPAATLTFQRSALDGHVTGTTIGTSPNTVTTSYDVDVSATSPGTGDLLGMSATVGATEVFSVTYERDELGRIARLDETVMGTSTSRQYQYDGTGRLVAVLDGSDAVVSEYDYDGNGARVRALTPSGELELGTEIGCGTGLSAPVDAQDRLCRYGNHEYVYDDNGRLFSKTNLSTSDVTEYTYDGLGRLRKVILPDATEIDYAYDPQGRRVGKVVDEVFVKGWRYGVDPLRPSAQLDVNGLIEKTFVYGERPNVPELIVDRVGGATYRVITDHLGSVRLIVNVASGTVVQQMSYDEFGQVVLDTNPGFQPFGFAGGLYDADTGLVRFGARDYDALTGRWTAKDPILFEGGTTNLYEYVGNDPVNRVDPRGEGWFESLFCKFLPPGYSDVCKVAACELEFEKCNIDNALCGTEAERIAHELACKVAMHACAHGLPNVKFPPGPFNKEQQCRGAGPCD